ncbi:MAG: HEAT repeat domain-containing protein [Gammaproteobacteria bacterium]|nr:HEAT repeat domain-containing protein [Gammaproteobacteria bacterium]
MERIKQQVKPNGIKLTDEQVRRFICDGVILLDSSLPPEYHQDIFEKMEWSNRQEFNMGNNVLPRIAELQELLDDPVIHGAVQSVLGDDYMLHPHRYMHANEPLAEADRSLELTGFEYQPPVGEGSTANSGWHQDGQCPLGRFRHHVPRIAMIIYFPQDTPAMRGPTRVIPGTHLHALLFESDFPFGLVGDHIKAGTCMLTAFDIAHGALSNRTDSSRYMFKFCYLRTRNPTGPSWDGGEVGWQAPEARLAQFEHTRTWSYIWDWMRGAPRFASRTDEVSSDVEKWIGKLNGADQKARLEAIYELAAMGAEAIGPLRESLLQFAGLEREIPPVYDPYRRKRERFTPDDEDRLVRRWNDGAVVPQDEAYALGAMGEVAMQPLIELLGHDDPWIKINAAFALGEIGEPAACAMPALARLLRHELPQVARASLDAMAFIGTDTRVALPAIRKLLTVNNPGWQEPSPRAGWTGENQARFNAMCALLNSDIPVEELDDVLVASLDDETGYVHAMALEALTERRAGEDRAGLRRALDYLMTHRWDHTLANDFRVY